MNQRRNPVGDQEVGTSQNDYGQGARHALLIGINQYDDAQVRNLEFAKADALAMYDILTDSKLGRFNPDNVTLLLDEQATKKAILEALLYDLPATVKPEDAVLIYYAGHGSPAPGFGRTLSPDGMERFIVPVDGSVGRIGASGINMREVKDAFASLGAWQVILTCPQNATASQ
jgi:uncharacterized caspase-like protein